jgi:hypothetical protein
MAPALPGRAPGRLSDRRDVDLNEPSEHPRKLRHFNHIGFSSG